MNSIHFLIIVLISVIFIQHSNEQQIPSYIRRCKYTLETEALNKCITEVAIEIQDRIIQDKDTFHLPSIDPANIDDFSFDAGATNAFRFRASFTNITVFGPSNFKIEKILFDTVNVELLAKAHFPHWRIQCQYKIDGNILILPLNSYGDADMNFTSIQMKDVYKGKRYSKNGKEYIEWISGYSNLDIEDGTLYLSNLVRTNQQLTKTANDIINDDLPTLLPELTHLMTPAIVKYRLKVLNIIFSQFPLNELFIMDS